MKTSLAMTVTVGLFALSGAGALLYEVCWMRSLGLLFGSTSQATAVTLATFFLGLAAGNAYWGKFAGRVAYPLKLYGGLELTVALSALLYFFLPELYRLIYPWLFERLQADFAWLLAVKFGLTLIALFPMTFFMGGTLPALSRLGSGNRLSVLYGANSLGAALGAFAAGFVLPHWLGYNGSYCVAMALSAGVGGMALVITVPTVSPVTATQAPSGLDRTLVVLALWSGIATLGLQVLWTRLFAQVLQNSVYTFAAVLTVFLLCLALGAILAHGLLRLRRTVDLFLLLTASGLAVATTPSLFLESTHGLDYVGIGLDWWDYVLAVLCLLIKVLGLPLLCLGAVFPCLLDKLPRDGFLSLSTGKLAAINTIGAIIGALLAGFIMLPGWGVWVSIQTIATIYLLAALGLAWKQAEYTRIWQPIVALILVYSVLDVSSIPLLHLDADEHALWLQEDSAATVAVVKNDDAQLRIKVNNHYTLGGTGSRTQEALQGYLPVRLHPQPERVFFLGMGTGISAGAALPAGAGFITVAELLPGVITAAKKFFGDYQYGLLQSFLSEDNTVDLSPSPCGESEARGAQPVGVRAKSVCDNQQCIDKLNCFALTLALSRRERGLLPEGEGDSKIDILPEDGRNLLAVSGQRYDVIVADLFVPWEAGASHLYALEHFQAVHDHLREAGWFMQWLPAYQLSADSFAIIVHTLQQIFPDVSLWRGDFSAQRPVLGLLARTQAGPLTTKRLAEKPVLFGQADTVPLAARLVAGDATLRTLYQNAPINRDDLPLIEWQAPVAQRQHKVGQINWLTGNTLLDLLDRLYSSDHTGSLMLPPAQQRLTDAGYRLHRAQLLKADGYLSAADVELSRYQKLAATAQPKLARRERWKSNN